MQERALAAWGIIGTEEIGVGFLWETLQIPAGVAPAVCLTVTAVCDHFSTPVCCKVDSAVSTNCPKGPAAGAEGHRFLLQSCVLPLNPTMRAKRSAGKLGMFCSADR